VLDLGIDLDVWPWVWMIIAVVFALVELTFVGGSFVLLPFAASAFVASILGFYDVAIEVQWAVFLFGGAALFGIFYKWARGFLDQHELAPGVGADRLVGLVGIVTVDISHDDTDRRGRVAVAGEVWGALAAGDDPVAEGTKVRITSMLGTRVVVEPVPATNSKVAPEQEEPE
jgi:membrane protein implicated in regulation of membrane protease activity